MSLNSQVFFESYLVKVGDQTKVDDWSRNMGQWSCMGKTRREATLVLVIFNGGLHCSDSLKYNKGIGITQSVVSNIS